MRLMARATQASFPRRFLSLSISSESQGCAATFVAIALYACTVVLSPAEVAPIFTKRAQNGTVIKLLRESSPITLPPIEARSWTNKDGSVSRMFPRPHKTNDFDVVTYADGRVETNGSIFRPPAPLRKDVFCVVEEVGGVARTNRTLELVEVRATFKQPRTVIDLEYEPPVAV